VALVIGIPLGSWGGRAYADFAASTLNFEIASYRVDGWVYLVQIAAALLIPLVGAAYPIYKGSRSTVRDALSDAGVSENAIGARPIDALLRRVQGLGRTYLLALRNTFRRQGRLVLTLLSLAVGGAVFMVALNVGVSWNKTVNAEFDARRYDAEIRLKQPYPAERLEAVLGTVSGVVDVETWVEVDASVTYPGGANGNTSYASDPFRLLALPPATPMIDFPLIEGRWLRPDDENALVVSHMLADHEPALAVGNQAVIELNGQATTWKVVGVVRQIGPDLVYANLGYYVSLTGLQGQTNNVRVVAEDHDADAQATTLQAMEAALLGEGLDVAVANTSQDGRQVLVDHLYIIVTLLMLMAVLVAAVGGLGLASTMSLNVLERRREIGVLRAVGATSLKVLQVVLGEGLFIGLLSWALAILFSLPLTRLIGNVTGRIFIEAPLVIAYSWSGVGLWLGVVLVLTAVASSLPAVSATELPVHQVLAYE
jgi:putative ABC transport system permease protein